jgi:thiamine biosynthesis lipoprotein
LLLSNCGVSTSGDPFQRLEINGIRFSHIIDPFTCVGMTNHALATVIAKNGMTADGLATAMTILEPSEALRLAGSYHAAVRAIRQENGQLLIRVNGRFKKLAVGE